MSDDPLSNLANVLTVVLALTAIGLSEGYQNREFFRLSVLPKLEKVAGTINGFGSVPGSDLGRSLSSNAVGLPADSVYTMVRGVRNDGLGPAIVRNFIVFRDSEKVYDARQSSQDYSFEEIRNDLDELPFQAGVGTSGFRAGEMIRAGEEQPLFMAAISKAGDQWTPSIVRDSVFQRRSFVLCYCSVYGTDCGMLTLGAPRPKGQACRF
jgi:hypothetical protein